MKRYRKKPVEIEAWRLPEYGEAAVDGEAHGQHEIAEEIARWCGGYVLACENGPGYGVMIPTLEGTMATSPGDFVVRGVAGEFYPCKPEIFEATYEEVGP